MSGSVLAAIDGGEEGHVAPAVGSIAAAVGAVVLAIGSANDSGGLAIVGGIVLGVGILAHSVLHHRQIDYGVFRDIDGLKGK